MQQQLEPFPEPFVIINHPAGATQLTTAEPSATVGGVANQVTQLLLEHKAGDPPQSSNATIPLASHWRTDELTLQPGDNQITVHGRGPADAPYSDTVTLTYNPGFKLDPVQASPRELDQGQSDPLLLSVKLHSPQLLSGAVQAHALDAQGKLATPALGPLNDQGQDGDVTAGDGIYSGRVTLDTSAPTTHQLRLTMGVSPASGAAYTALSERVSVEVLPPLTAQHSTELGAAMAFCQSRYAELEKSAASTHDAMSALQQELAQQSGVHEAVLGPEGDEVWWTMTSGIAAGFTDPPEGTLAGGGDQALLRLDTVILEPYRSQLNLSESLIPELSDLLDGVRCPRVSAKDTAVDAAADLELLKQLHNYTLVAVTSHGGFVPYKLKYAKLARGQNLFSVLTKVDTTNLEGTPFRKEVLAGRLVPLGSAKRGFRWGATGRFFAHYLEPFAPGSVVHVTACSSARSLALARAFFKKGARVYSGFSNTVYANYGHDMALTYFDQLRLGKTVQQAVLAARNKHGWHDPAMKSNHGITTRLVSLVNDSAARAGVECDGTTQLVMDWDPYTDVQRHALYYSMDRLEHDFGSAGTHYHIKEAHKSCESSWKDLAQGKTWLGQGSYHDVYAGMFEFKPEKRSTITKLTIDREAKTVRIVPVPLGADFEASDGWVSWPADSPGGETGNCAFATSSLVRLKTTDYGEDQVEFGEDYVRGRIQFDFSADDHLDQARGTLEFDYDLLPTK